MYTIHYIIYEHFIDDRLLFWKGVAASFEFIAGRVTTEGASKATLLWREILKLVELP